MSKYKLKVSRSPLQERAISEAMYGEPIPGSRGALQIANGLLEQQGFSQVRGSCFTQLLTAMGMFYVAQEMGDEATCVADLTEDQELDFIYRAVGLEVNVRVLAENSVLNVVSLCYLPDSATIDLVALCSDALRHIKFKAAFDFSGDSCELNEDAFVAYDRFWSGFDPLGDLSDDCVRSDKYSKSSMIGMPGKDSAVVDVECKFDVAEVYAGIRSDVGRIDLGSEQDLRSEDGYCYLHFFAAGVRGQVAALLGANPTVRSVLKAVYSYPCDWYAIADLSVASVGTGFHVVTETQGCDSVPALTLIVAAAEVVDAENYGKAKVYAVLSSLGGMHRRVSRKRVDELSCVRRFGLADCVIGSGSGASANINDQLGNQMMVESGSSDQNNSGSVHFDLGSRGSNGAVQVWFENQADMDQVRRCCRLPPAFNGEFKVFNGKRYEHCLLFVPGAIHIGDDRVLAIRTVGHRDCCLFRRLFAESESPLAIDMAWYDFPEVPNCTVGHSWISSLLSLIPASLYSQCVIESTRMDLGLTEAELLSSFCMRLGRTSLSDDGTQGEQSGTVVTGVLDKNDPTFRQFRGMFNQVCAHDDGSLRVDLNDVRVRCQFEIVQPDVMGERDKVVLKPCPFFRRLYIESGGGHSAFDVTRCATLGEQTCLVGHAWVSYLAYGND